MIADSLQIRRAAIAYLYQLVPALNRRDNMAFYEELTKQGADFPEMNQQPQELALFRRTAGSLDQVAEVRVGALAIQAAPAPSGVVPSAFRFLVAEQGSARPLQAFEESADIIYEAFKHIWAGRAGRLQLAEVSFMLTVAIDEPDGAMAFLSKYATKTGEPARSHLGRNFDGLAIKLNSNPVIALGVASDVVPLAGAQIELTLEPFPQDLRQLFMNVIVRWPLLQFKISDIQLPPEARQAAGTREFFELNNEPREPSSYLTQAYGYAEHHILPFLNALRRGHE
jgi:hypothetical protein